MCLSPVTCYCRCLSLFFSSHQMTVTCYCRCLSLYFSSHQMTVTCYCHCLSLFFSCHQMTVTSYCRCLLIRRCQSTAALPDAGEKGSRGGWEASLQQEAQVFDRRPQAVPDTQRKWKGQAMNSAGGRSGNELSRERSGNELCRGKVRQ